MGVESFLFKFSDQNKKELYFWIERDGKEDLSSLSRSRGTANSDQMLTELLIVQHDDFVHFLAHELGRRHFICKAQQKKTELGRLELPVL